jgi:sulfatase maturation enzyme AslB (radical SAM superfamily)
MSSETFEKMLKITDDILEHGDYQTAVFRLSGGEPLLAFDNYKDLVTEYTKKTSGKITFGLLTNLTILTDEMITWLKENEIGIQVSLDDLENSKPLVSGESSAKVTRNNIDKLLKNDIGFSINTVLDIEKTQSLNKMANYVATMPNLTWGLNGSYTLKDADRVDDMLSIFKDAVLILFGNGFDVYRRLRFYNMVLENASGTCSAGINVFALGTNLEMWSCQSIIDKKPMGYFDERFEDTLKNSEEIKPYRLRLINTSEKERCTGFAPIVALFNTAAVDVDRSTLTISVWKRHVALNKKSFPLF